MGIAGQPGLEGVGGGQTVPHEHSKPGKYLALRIWGPRHKFEYIMLNLGTHTHCRDIYPFFTRSFLYEKRGG